MTPEEVRELAKATCCWLAYKDLTGFGKMLSDATLSLPISEFLTTRTSWMLHSELYYRKLPGAAKLPEFSCDFAGIRKGGKGEVQFILEAKYLKVNAENMRGPIASDFVRLALPEGRTLKRYFLLAGESQHFPPSNANFLFDKTLFGMGDKQWSLYPTG